MEEEKIVKKLSGVGIAGNVVLAAFKLIAGILGKSGAMVSDAVAPTVTVSEAVPPLVSTPNL